jgi:predicted transposase/invertase (TIGR01784 family)
MKNHVQRPQSHGANKYPKDIQRLARQYAAQGKILDIRLDIVFKTVRLDIHVTFNEGETADLEMQMELGDDDILARAVFYAARLVSGQGRKGEFYAGIKRVYQIFFINAVLFPQSALVPRRYTLLEKTEGDPLNDLVEICFYELPKLEAKVLRVLEGKEGVESLSPEEKWCIYFRYHRDEGKGELLKELIRGDEGIMSAEKVLTTMSRDYEEWAQALFREKVEMDYRSGMHAAEMKGYKRAEAEIQAAKQQAEEYRRQLQEAQAKLREAGL